MDDKMLLVLCFAYFLLQEILTEDIFVDKDSSVCLNCTVEDEIKDITWLGPPNDMLYISGTQVEKRYPDIYLNGTSGRSVLCIRKVTNNYTGNYTCYGKHLQNKPFYKVIFKEKPTNMIIEPKNHPGQSLGISEDKETVLNCSITKGEPAGALRWTFKNKQLASDYVEKISLVITPTKLDNGNVYTCQALDHKGNVVLQENVTINVLGRPETPSFVDSIEMPTSVTIKWNSTYDGGYPQTFVVQHQKFRDSSNDNNWLNTTVVGQNHIVLLNLTPETHYLVRMYAFNKINRSEYSAEIMVSTSQTSSSMGEDSDSSRSGYYALVVIPVLLVIVFMVYFIRGNRLPVSIKRFWASQDEDQEQNVVDVGPGAVGNDLYGQANIPPPNRQNDEVQVYSSFDRRHNITLSTHAQSASYDVRPKQKPNNGRNKKKAAKEKRPTNDTRQIEESQNAQQLNYVEVSFDTQRSGNRVKIHGKKQPSTDYVDIDFTKKFIAPPVQANNADSDDDFESEYEIKKMKRRTKLQEK